MVEGLHVLLWRWCPPQRRKAKGAGEAMQEINNEGEEGVEEGREVDFPARGLGRT